MADMTKYTVDHRRLGMLVKHHDCDGGVAIPTRDFPMTAEDLFLRIQAHDEACKRRSEIMRPDHV